jgi:lipopolysaccharide biosynthesis glycosyltransferase
MISVIFCSDANYVQHLGVALASLLSNNRKHEFLITVVTVEDDPDSKSALAQIAANHGNAEIQFKTFDLRRIAHLKTLRYITAAAYLRLFMTEFVDGTVSKVLYLDSDVIVCRDVEALWKTNVNGYAMAAVRDHSLGYSLSDPYIPPECYFNTGVLLVNLDKWRQSGAPERLIQYAEEHRGVGAFHDQDVLNAVFSKDTYLLGLEWNFQARMADSTADELGLERQYFAAVREDPAIVHFTSRAKPWTYGAEVNYESLYFKYLALTPWRGYIPQDKTLRASALRLLRMRHLKRQIKWRYPRIGLLMRGARSAWSRSYLAVTALGRWPLTRFDRNPDS